ncbi:hypothetical protein KAZ93_04920 [Patescibacteria group bacterium]|nr:hypothetical protein [Patescibacteria group bacterium]
MCESEERLIGSTRSSIDEMVKADDTNMWVLLYLRIDHSLGIITRTIIDDDYRRKSCSDDLIDHRS